MIDLVQVSMDWVNVTIGSHEFLIDKRYFSFFFKLSSIIIIIISKSPFFHLNHNLSLFVSSCCFSQQCSLSLTFFFSPFAPSLSVGSSFVVRPSSLVYFSARNFTQGFSSPLFYLFIHSKWFVCFPSIFHNSWNTLRFSFLCMSSILHFFFVVVMVSPHSIIIIHQASLKCMWYLSVADLHVLSSSLLSEKSQIFNQKRNCLQSSAGDGELLQLNYALNSPLLYMFFCWVVVVGILSRKVVNNEAKQERLFHSWLQNQKQIFLPSSSPYNPSLMR